MTVSFFLFRPFRSHVYIVRIPLSPLDPSHHLYLQILLALEIHQAPYTHPSFLATC
jgi:hypothetical protein